MHGKNFWPFFLLLFSSRGRRVPSGRPGEERVPGRIAEAAAPPGVGAQTFSPGSGSSTSNCKLLKFRSRARGRIPGAPGAWGRKEPGGDLDSSPGASESCAFVASVPDRPSIDSGPGSLVSEISTSSADQQPGRPAECSFESWEVASWLGVPGPARPSWRRELRKEKNLKPLICN